MTSSLLTRESVHNRRQKASLLRLQAVFYFVTALSSAGYVSYILVYYNTAVSASGLVKTALLLLAGSLFLEAVAEVPSGAFADRFGYEWAVKWSFVLFFLHSVAYLAASFLLRGASPGFHPLQFGLVSLGEALLACGTALQSGALTSWFVTSIKREGYIGDLTPFMARKRFTTNLTWLIVGLFISLILKGPGPVPAAFVVGAVAYMAAFLVTLRLIIKPDGERPLSSVMPFPSLYQITKEEFYGALSEMLKYRKLLIVSLTHAVFWTLGVIQTYFWRQILNIDETGSSFLPYLSVIWFFFAFGQIAGNEIAARIRVYEVSKRDNRVIYFNIGQILMGLSMLVIVNFRLNANTSTTAFVLAAVLLSVSRLGRELSKPLTMAWTHEEIRNDRYRATIESLIEASAAFVIVLIVVPITILSKEEGTITQEGDNLIRIIVTILSCATLLVNIPITWFAMRGQRTSPGRQSVAPPEQPTITS